MASSRMNFTVTYTCDYLGESADNIDVIPDDGCYVETCGIVNKHLGL